MSLTVGVSRPLVYVETPGPNEDQSRRDQVDDFWSTSPLTPDGKCRTTRNLPSEYSRPSAGAPPTST